MKVIVSYIVQGGGSLLHVLNLIAGSQYLSPAGQAKLAGVIGFIQSAIGVVAHFYNPDGSNSKVAWVPLK